MNEIKIERVDPRSDSYSALMWDVITNAHRYIPRAGETVLDLGAHYGMFALYCAARGCKVYAFEPQPIPYHELCHTAEVAAEIGLGEIIPRKAAVSELGGFAFMQKAGSTATASIVRVGGEPCGEVHTIPFDRVLYSRPKWDCVKMDIEGAEYQVLTKSSELGRVFYLTVEIHNDILGPQRCEEIRETLEKEFRYVDRLLNKDNPREVVAYFCRR